MFLLDTKNITDNIFFLKTVKLFLANKISSNRSKITLTQKDEIISRSKDVAEIFNTFFVNVVSNLQSRTKYLEQNGIIQ